MKTLIFIRLDSDQCGAAFQMSTEAPDNYVAYIYKNGDPRYSEWSTSFTTLDELKQKLEANYSGHNIEILDP